MNSLQEIIEEVCCQQCNVDPELLEQVVVLAVEIAREGREGRKIGTLFVVGDTDAVMQRSRSLILDPLVGHPDHLKRLGDPNMRETVKELAQLDGGFVITEQGIVASAARYFSASTEGIELPLGLGSRHMAGASITRETNAIAIVVSESSTVSIFDGGKRLSKIIPELWLLRHQDRYLRGEMIRVADVVTEKEEV